jgi:hypothetical protein
MLTTEAKARPIIFSAESVRAILAGTKTQTRRLVKWKPREPGLNLGFSGLEAGAYANDNPATGWVLRSRDGRGTWNDRTHPLKCRYGLEGDLLWVREAWADCGTYYRYFATDHVHELRKRRSAARMPRVASRITLRVERVRVERLWSITEEDAAAEGVVRIERSVHLHGRLDGYGIEGTPPEHAHTTRVNAYRAYWDALNASRGFGWALNPWVWVVEFGR